MMSHQDDKTENFMMSANVNEEDPSVKSQLSVSCETNAALRSPGGPASPSIPLRDVIRDCEFACKVLEKKEVDWKDRMLALDRLRKAAEQGAAGYEEFLDYLSRIREPLCGQLKDLRSTIVKEASSAFAAFASAFQVEGVRQGTYKWSPRFASIAFAAVEICLKQTCVSIKVISESADSCIRAIIECAAPFGVGKILSKCCEAVTEKASHLRLVSIEYIDLILRKWSGIMRSSNTRRLTEVRAAVQTALSDADEKNRNTARSCYWVFHARCPELAEPIMKRLDSSSQRRLLAAQSDVQFEADLSPRVRVSPASSQDRKLASGNKNPATSSMSSLPTTASSPNDFSPLEFQSETTSELDTGSFRSDVLSFKTNEDFQNDFDTVSSGGSQGSLQRGASPIPSQRSSSSGFHQHVSPAAPSSYATSETSDASAGASANAQHGLRAGRPMRSGPQRVQAQPSPLLKGRDTRDYQPGDYADASSKPTRSQNGPRRVMGAQRVATRPPRTVGLPQQTQQQALQEPRSTMGFAKRVEQNLGASVTTTNSSETQGPRPERAALREPMNSRSQSQFSFSATNSGPAPGYAHSEASEASASVGSLTAHLRELESNPHWSARKDAVEAIMSALMDSPNGFPPVFAAKLIPALCAKAADERRHHKVAQDVLKCICLMLPKHAKDFSDYLKILVPALLAGTKDGKLPIRRFSSEAMDLCFEHFPADLLAGMLSELSKQKGDSKRLAALEYLEKIVPLTRHFFTTGLHVFQVIRRADRSLSSRNLDMRKAATAVLLAVYKHDPALFVQQLESNELPGDVRDRAEKVCKDNISNFDESKRSHLENARANQPPQYAGATLASQNKMSSPQSPRSVTRQEPGSARGSLSRSQSQLSQRSIASRHMKEHQQDEDETIELLDTNHVLKVVNEDATQPELTQSPADTDPFDVLHNDHENVNSPVPASRGMVHHEELLLGSPFQTIESETKVEAVRASPRVNAASLKPLTPQRFDMRPASSSPPIFPLAPEQTTPADAIADLNSFETTVSQLLLQLKSSDASVHASAWGQLSSWASRVDVRHNTASDSNYWAGQIAQACIDELNQNELSVKLEALLLLQLLLKHHYEGLDSLVENIFQAIFNIEGGTPDVVVHNYMKAPLLLIAESCDPSRCLPLILQVLGNPTVTAQDACIDMLRALTRRMPSEKVLDLLTQIHPALIEFLDHSDTQVRKAATYLFVEMNETCGKESLAPYLDMLKQDKRNLVNTYIRRGLPGSR